MSDETPELVDNESSVSGAELVTFCERAESVQEEIDDARGAMKDLRNELKGRGFDLKAFTAILRLRKMERDQRLEEEAILELYKQAVGL
ncbi:GapR family DNA-binding domain-containing protein [Methylobacterium sp. WL120]|uniref:DUF2312 domain-containing protein n=1 Tax=Methylobacterium sp. WL120 TaxID=2603887 RepID=UPI0011C9B2E9|nr:GapR family DNA-binding domain-containing protein [Methylobacterium sp. WL120]TXM69607.1 DUF2312 domain-containing protein [Methylobacterium sp. WL120]